MKTILSCIQPTGDLHLGNYFGAVNNWVEHQKSYKCFYGVVDYHSMTMPYNPKKLRENTWNMIFQLLACGVNIENLSSVRRIQGSRCDAKVDPRIHIVPPKEFGTGELRTERLQVVPDFGALDQMI